MINELSDYHIHTAYRPGDDGAADMTVQYLVEYAESYGYKELGITPHCFFGGKGEHLRQIRRELEEVQTDIPIYLGVESDFIDCGLNTAIDASSFSLVDYLIGAADHFNCEGIEKPPVAMGAMIDYQHQKLLNMVKHPWVDVIAHPWTGLMLLTTLKHLPDHQPLKSLSEVPESYLHEFAKAAVTGNKAVEVNGYFVCEYPDKIDNPKKYLKDLAHFYYILAEEGVIFSINSDAHSPGQLVYAKQAREFLISIGLESVPIWHPNRAKKD